MDGFSDIFSDTFSDKRNACVFYFVFNKADFKGIILFQL